jgi:hypothetical protein
MWRALIRRGRAAGFPVNLALDQQCHPAGQQRNLAFLPRHDIGQILDCPGQVGDAFFQLGLIGHAVLQRLSGAGCKGFLAPVPVAG